LFSFSACVAEAAFLFLVVLDMDFQPKEENFEQVQEEEVTSSSQPGTWHYVQHAIDFQEGHGGHSEEQALTSVDVGKDQADGHVVVFQGGQLEMCSTSSTQELLQIPASGSGDGHVESGGGQQDVFGANFLDQNGSHVTLQEFPAHGHSQLVFLSEGDQQGDTPFGVGPSVNVGSDFFVQSGNEDKANVIQVSGVDRPVSVSLLLS